MFNVAITLAYLTTILTPSSPHQYSGFLGNNTQTEYNALNWTDIRPKPTWGTILANADAAWAWYESTRPYSAAEVKAKIDGLQSEVDTVELDVEGKSDDPHSHPINQVDGLTSALSGTAALNHAHVIPEVSGLQVVLNTTSDALNSLTAELATKAPLSHPHVISEITNLQTTLTNLQTQIDTTPPISHNHTASQITDFSTTSRGLFSGSNGITYDNSTGVIAPTYGATTNTICQGNDTRLSDARTPLTHNHAASQVTDFTVTARGTISASNGLSYNASTGVMAPTYGTELNTFCQGNDSRLSDARTPTAHVHVIADTTGLQAALDGKAALSHVHVIADVTNLQTELNKRSTIYVGTALKTNPKMITTSAAISGGTVVFPLVDGSNNALFANVYLTSALFLVSDTANQYQFAWLSGLSGDKKALTVSVSKIGTANILTGILGYGAAPNGVVINLTIWGD